MRKIKQLFVLLFALVLVVPFGVNAAQEKKLTEEKKTTEETTVEPVKVYLFHGATCPHCLETIEWFESIEEEYGDYFDLIKFEVWSNQTNAEFMQTVADKMGDEAGGVPYIIVGNYTWPNGFAPDVTVDKKGTTMAEDMIAKIMDTYNSKKRYDVMDGLNMPTPDSDIVAPTEEEETEEKKSDTVVAVVAVLILAGLTTVAVITRKNSK